MRIRWPFSSSPRPMRALGLTVALGAAAACQGSSPGAPAGGGGGRPAVPVEIATLAPQPVEQTGEFVGTVRSRRVTTVQPQAEGLVTRIFVRSGDRVDRGAPIIDIDDRSQQAVVANLRSLRAAREADATFARQQVERQQALLASGAASRQDFERAEAELRNALAQLAAVEDQIRLQQNELAYHRVVAPTAGVVGDVPVNVGDSVNRATVVTTIDDSAELEVYIGVPVQLAPRLALGAPVRLVAEAGDVIAATRVSFIAPSVDDATQTVLVKAPVPASAGLRTDQFVRVRIVWTTEPSLTIPVVSVVRINGQVFAFVAAPGEDGGLVARQRPITVGPVIGSDYVVLDGLEAGELLIVSGLQKIGDGAPVRDLDGERDAPGEGSLPAAPAAPGPGREAP